MTEAELDRMSRHRSRQIHTRAFIPDYGELPTLPSSDDNYAYGSTGSHQELNTWLRDHYHPIFKVRGVSRTGRVVGYIRIFTGQEQFWPSKFIEPNMLFGDVYQYAQLFTYDIIHEYKLGAVISHFCTRYEGGGYKDARHEFKNDIAVEIDKFLLKKYKSMPNMADALYRFITNR